MVTDLSPQDVSPSPAPSGAPGGWTCRRIVALVAGAVLALVSFGLVAGSAFVAWADLAQSRSGYLTVGTGSYVTSGYALTSNPVSLREGWGWLGWIACRR